MIAFPQGRQSHDLIRQGYNLIRLRPATSIARSEAKETYSRAGKKRRSAIHGFLTFHVRHYPAPTDAPLPITIQPSRLQPPHDGQSTRHSSWTRRRIGAYCRSLCYRTLGGHLCADVRSYLLRQRTLYNYDFLINISQALLFYSVRQVPRILVTLRTRMTRLVSNYVFV